MRIYKRKPGYTLTELLVVISVMAVLMAIGVPTVRKVIESFESGAGVIGVIDSALASARAIAAREQSYAGLRFQQDPAGNQYMIFIIHDPEILAYGFRAVAGLRPMKLPKTVGVMDLRLGSLADEVVDTDDEINTTMPIYSASLNDVTTFSIIYSPAGKIVQHDVRVRRKDSGDDVFNTITNVDNGIGMFYQDSDNDSKDLGWDQESSRKSFVIYDKRQFASVNVTSRFTDYLRYLTVVYINPYSGEIVNK